MVRRKFTLYAFLLLIFGSQIYPFLNSSQDELKKELDDYILTAVDAGFSGAVMVVKGGEVVLHEGYGLADREKNIPVNKDTVFDIGSITKRFTRAAILKLEEQGKLKRSDTLSKYFKDIPEDKAAITVEQVLEHTAGFHEYHDTKGDFEEMNREQALKTILSQKLRFEPGAQEAYSNSGYGLLAILIELVSEQSYTSFLQENLFKPAGMDRTGFYRDPLWEEDEVAVGYEGRKIGEINSPFYWPRMTWALVGGGGMVSSVGELYKWIQALQSNTVLSEKAKEKMVDPQGRPMAYAGGNDFGFSSVVFEYPNDKNYIIVATNSHDNISAPTLGRQLSAILKGEEPEEIKPEEIKEEASASQEWGLPDSATGRRARAILEAINRQDLDYVQKFLKENCTPAFVNQFPMEEHLSVFKGVHKMMGDIELLGAKKTSEFNAEILIQSKKSGKQLRISFELEAVTPFLIAGIDISEEKD
ncbi:MAG: beta-lactamase family protein [Candidatus Aminicenantes bacterium]|nr:beta-lactamase family protein [Candidatus Aminicenantes bacterium]